MTVLLHHDLVNERVLLGQKKRGFGMGKWNGYGGKAKEGETIERSARREFFEEAGILAGDIERIDRGDSRSLGQRAVR